MKTVFSFFFAVCFLTGSAVATPFFVQGYNSDGSPQTNAIKASFWPQSSDSPFVTYGTNIIYAANEVTISPNAAGYASNWLFPGTYRFSIPALGVAYLAVIPDTTNFLSVANYTTNLNGYPGIGLNSFGLVTNWLGFSPATNSSSGIISALGFFPTTNNFYGITNALGFAPATNSNAGIIFALGFTPATNNFSGITNALGFAPATNSAAGIAGALGYSPATNSSAGAISALGYTPATNSFSGLTNALGFSPGTNSGYVGIGTAVANLTTNGFLVWAAYKTNGVPGTAFTNLPQGSLLTTTNGSLFVLSNLVWFIK